MIALANLDGQSAKYLCYPISDETTKHNATVFYCMKCVHIYLAI